MNRRQFLQAAALAAVSTGGLAGCASLGQPKPVVLTGPLYRISLAQWSLHRAFRGRELDPMDFPRIARRDYNIDGIEYVNQFYVGKATDASFLRDMRDRCDSEGVTSVLIMCDNEGRLGDPDEARRAEAVENHRKWLDAAKYLGCHSIRVNAYSSGDYNEQLRLAADGLRRLCGIARPLGLNVLVENHGGYSSNGTWLAAVMRETAMPNVGTLPDFGNFTDYDRYLGVAEMLPFAKGVSAKSHDFDYQGNETKTDFHKMLAMVYRAGYRDWVGVEYEGSVHSEPAGIRLTKRLLERVRDEITGNLRAGTFV